MGPNASMPNIPDAIRDQSGAGREHLQLLKEATEGMHGTLRQQMVDVTAATQKIDRVGEAVAQHHLEAQNESQHHSVETSRISNAIPKRANSSVEDAVTASTLHSVATKAKLHVFAAEVD